jgi:hypothetical protein
MSRLEQRLEQLYRDSAIDQSAAGSFHDKSLLALSGQVNPNRAVEGPVFGGRPVGGARPPIGGGGACRARGTPAQKQAAAKNPWNVYVRQFWSPGMPWSEAIKAAVAAGGYAKRGTR